MVTEASWWRKRVLLFSEASPFIARSEATKQSIYPLAAAWIASAFALRATADKSLRSQ
jgi:hypothetical protein